MLQGSFIGAFSFMHSSIWFNGNSMDPLVQGDLTGAWWNEPGHRQRWGNVPCQCGSQQSLEPGWPPPKHLTLPLRFLIVDGIRVTYVHYPSVACVRFYVSIYRIYIYILRIYIYISYIKTSSTQMIFVRHVFLEDLVTLRLQGLTFYRGSWHQ